MGNLFSFNRSFKFLDKIAKISKFLEKIAKISSLWKKLQISQGFGKFFVASDGVENLEKW